MSLLDRVADAIKAYLDNAAASGVPIDPRHMAESLLEALT